MQGVGLEHLAGLGSSLAAASPAFRDGPRQVCSPLPPDPVTGTGHPTESFLRHRQIQTQTHHRQEISSVEPPAAVAQANSGEYSAQIG